MKRLKLPDAPANQTGPVKAWTEPVVIPTYHPLPPDKNPMFLEKRVYQGSSGRVYPLPFTDRISTDSVEHSWQAVHLENEFLRVMVLPEIGGRIHVGMDKTNEYDFFYRQNVIKPALVGLAGPWISGGVEFNWPQHHRPTTFMPVSFQIEEDAGGSRIIWCSDHDPMNRLKGMHGVCLHPGKAYIELKVRLYNRTPLVQTFLWWANIGVHVHELYQSFFPPDVQFVTDHAKRAMSRFPLCDDYYYGVNYSERGRKGVAAEEQPLKFVPPGNYPPNDLRWYANIPVPTSYMAMGSSEDFHGGYDHKRKAGLVLVADHHIAPGKKQWTWGNHPFGYAWDRNLTDEDGPYIELMAGVYTDNQPDFSFLAPGETKTFSQYWYPIREIGPAHKANRDVALSFQISMCEARIGVCATQAFPAARVRLESAIGQIAEWQCNLKPGSAFLQVAELPAGIKESELSLIVESREGQALLRYTPTPPGKQGVPSAASEPGLPEEIQSNDELYITGLHLDQYRHATRYADAYWREALRRDGGDSRCNNAMGSWHLRRAEFAEAEKFFRKGVQALTNRNPNPWEGEAFYNLGLTLRYLRRDEEAYAVFYKATWNAAWRSTAYFALAELDAKRGDWNASIEHLESSLRTNVENLNARNLSVVVLRKLGRAVEADRLLEETLALDPLDSWTRYLASNSLPNGNQMLFDLALDYTRAGLYPEAVELLGRTDRKARNGSVPILLYALGHSYLQLGNTAVAERTYSEASIAPPDYCCPNRLEEFVILQEAVSAYPEDARAAYYLGNLLYDRRRHREAIALWERAARRDPSFSTVWRNLGISYFNVLGDEELSRSAFDKAIQANPGDARILYERDQLWKRLGESPERRLTELEKCAELVRLRDDLSVELATLYNQTRQHERALSLLASRMFQPWEGGEGLALGQYVRANLALGRQALAQGNSLEARRLFEAALRCPENLGEATHLLANQSDVYCFLGSTFEAEGDHASAQPWFEHAARHNGDFQEMSAQSFSEMSYYNALALKQLGQAREAEELLRSLLAHAQALARQVARIDYFATSLPTMLLFEDDLQKRKTVTATFLSAQAWLGLGDSARARELLHEVLGLDRNHSRAADMLAALEAAGSRSSVDTNTRPPT
jgi:tetratricopeptide (TPR) repeat protein